jgi:hypothetical protein
MRKCHNILYIIYLYFDVVLYYPSCDQTNDVEIDHISLRSTMGVRPAKSIPAEAAVRYAIDPNDLAGGIGPVSWVHLDVPVLNAHVSCPMFPFERTPP